MKRMIFLSLLLVSLSALHAADPEANDTNCEVRIEIQEALEKTEMDQDAEQVDERVVPGASYVIKDLVSPLFGNKKTTFYAADGTQLLRTSDTTKMVDPAAAKPEIHSVRFCSLRDDLPFGLDLRDKEGRSIGFCELKVRCYASDETLSQFDLSKIKGYQRTVLKESLIRVKANKSKESQ